MPAPPVLELSTLPGVENVAPMNQTASPGSKYKLGLFGWGGMACRAAIGLLVLLIARARVRDAAFADPDIAVTERRGCRG